jgi:hypothetical protein
MTKLIAPDWRSGLGSVPLLRNTLGSMAVIIETNAPRKALDAL